LGPPLVNSVNDLRYRNNNILHFWPNPANDFIIIDPGDSQKAGLLNISIFDLQGRELINVPLRGDRIDISSLREGLYIITARSNGRPQGYNRLVKTK